MRTRLTALALGAITSLVPQLSRVDRVNGASGIVNPCYSSASSATGVNIACPQGDGVALNSTGLTISVTIKDNTNAAIPGIPAGDFWLIGCNSALILCGGSRAINASGSTNALGQTTYTGDIAAGGCDSGVKAVCQGIIIGCPATCLGIAVRTADLTGPTGHPDNKIDSLDFARFVADYRSPPKPYNSCIDYLAPFGVVDLKDFAVFGHHNGHKCV